MTLQVYLVFTTICLIQLGVILLAAKYWNPTLDNLFGSVRDHWTNGTILITLVAALIPALNIFWVCALGVYILLVLVVTTINGIVNWVDNSPKLKTFLSGNIFKEPQ
jgi:magnesium-transporting ATPase (P-type)